LFRDGIEKDKPLSETSVQTILGNQIFIKAFAEIAKKHDKTIVKERLSVVLKAYRAFYKTTESGEEFLKFLDKFLGRLGESEGQNKPIGKEKNKHKNKQR